MNWEISGHILSLSIALCRRSILLLSHRPPWASTSTLRLLMPYLARKIDTAILRMAADGRAKATTLLSAKNDKNLCHGFHGASASLHFKVGLRTYVANDQTSP